MAIAYEASGTATGAFASSASFSLNSGSNPDICVLSAGACDRSGATTLNSSTYNSVALSANTTFLGPNSQDGRLFYLLNAASGANTLVLTASDGNARLSLLGAAYSGVDTSTGVGSQATGQNTSSSPSVTITGAAGETAVAFLFFAAPSGITVTEGSGVTKRQDTLADQLRVVLLEKASASSVVVDCTLSGAREWWMVGVSLKASGGAASFPKTNRFLLGVG